MRKVIYADHAATTPLSPIAKSAMEPYLIMDFYNPSTKYSASRNARRAVEEARATIARCIGAKPSEVYFTSGGTESDNWAIKGTMLVRGDERAIITSAFEHHAVLNSCSFIEKMGYPASYLIPDQYGYIQCSSLAKAIMSDTKLVSLMMVNNELGTIQPIKELCRMAHDHGALFHTDAVQAVGHIKVDVEDLGVDMLSASAHKFGGPKGVGFLYLREGIELEPLLAGGGQERGLRAGTENVPGIVGMAAALNNSNAHLLETQAHMHMLRDRFVRQMEATELDYRINGGNDTYPGTISLSIKGCNGEMLLHRLDLMGIEVATGSACDSKETQISHVLAAIDIPSEYALGTIRISFGGDNTLDDVDAIVTGICRIQKVRF